MTAQSTPSLDSFKCRQTLEIGGETFHYFSLPEAEKNGLEGISKLPFSLKVLLENLLRHEDGRSVTADDIRAVAEWLKEKKSSREIAYRPARVLMQDFTGVPAVVDLAAMRDAMAAMGGDPQAINPQVPVDLVIDHSVMVDYFGHPDSFERNVAREYERNGERYAFLKWGAEAFDNFRVVPPGTGICHQVNLEYLAQTVWTRQSANGSAETYAFPDTLVGTDSHTTMVNGLSVLGWGVGGIEAEAAMLGQPISMLIPEVVGFKLSGELAEGRDGDGSGAHGDANAARARRGRQVCRILRPGPRPSLARGSSHDRQHGAGIWRNLRIFPGRYRYAQLSESSPGGKRIAIALVEAYAKAQGMWRDTDTPDPIFSDTLALELTARAAEFGGTETASGPDRACAARPNRSRPLRKRTNSARQASPTKRVNVAGANQVLIWATAMW